VRAELSFADDILDIADDGTNDWGEAANGKPIVQKELVLRSKLRIEARRFHLERLHRETWGDKQQIDVKTDMTRLTPEERQRKADEVLEMLRALAAGPPKPPPLIYDPTEGDDEPEPEGGIGRRSSR
jgi:terminase small subunit-like protein